jgi:PAS domain S-box-containing protein
LSGQADKDFRNKCFAAGANDFISKPILMEEVLVRINAHIALNCWSRNLEEQTVERTTEVKQFNIKLQESEERFRAFMDNIPASVYIKDEENRHIYGNAMALESVGKKPEEFIGMTTRDLWPPQLAERLIELDRQVLHGKTPNITEEWRNTEADDKRWRQDIKFPITLRSGKKLLGGIAFDITSIKQNENKLKEAYSEIRRLKQKIEQENIYLKKEIRFLHPHDRIVGKTQVIQSTLSQAEMVAPHNTTVLILGETGTGKELLAHAIHNVSPRKNRSMITINCASLPATLIEGELFGREKGAYTGALTKQPGRFELANQSTIFLDEIGDLPLDLQAKLLRVVEEGQFERLGSTKTINVNTRIIAATNHDLEQEVKEGKFRADLYYRLSAYPITVPPLRDRQDDIPLLVWAFVKDFSKRMGKQVEKISKKSMDKLQSYSWPGNVRQLRNVVERAMILHSGPTLYFEEIGSTNSDGKPSMILQNVERNHILRVLSKSQWKVSGKNGAAETLGLKESTLRARMGKLGIIKKDNRQNLTKYCKP